MNQTQSIFVDLTPPCKQPHIGKNVCAHIVAKNISALIVFDVRFGKRTQTTTTTITIAAYRFIAVIRIGKNYRFRCVCFDVVKANLPQQWVKKENTENERRKFAKLFHLSPKIGFKYLQGLFMKFVLI